MAKIISGDRVGRRGRLGVGCSASVFDQKYGKMLLVRRADNGLWAVPGSYMEPGENFTEACKREVLEETGLDVSIKGLIAVYTSPHHLLEYPDGNKWQLVILHFDAEIIGGGLTAGGETSAVGFYSYMEMQDLNMKELDRRRALDGFARSSEAYVRDDFTLWLSCINSYLVFGSSCPAGLRGFCRA